MKSIDQIYLERLLKALQSLLKRLNKGKPGSAFSKAEIRALSDFMIEAPKGLSSFVRSLHNQLWLIAELPTAKRSSTIFHIKMQISSAQRLFALFKTIEIRRLVAVQKELTAQNVMKMNRKVLSPKKDTVFENMILTFLKTGGKFNDHIYKNIAMLPKLYVSILDYYLKHKKEIQGSRQWYDFLAISNYMLNGIKLEILLLQRQKRR